MSDLPDYTRTTPCIGLCSTVYGDLVCRGCKRFSHEIIDWNRYDHQQKAAVWQRLEQLLELETSGLRLRRHCAGLSLKQLRDELDSAYFDLSSAYHERRIGTAG